MAADANQSQGKNLEHTTPNENIAWKVLNNAVRAFRDN